MLVCSKTLTESSLAHIYHYISPPNFLFNRKHMNTRQKNTVDLFSLKRNHNNIYYTCTITHKYYSRWIFSAIMNRLNITLFLWRWGRISSLINDIRKLTRNISMKYEMSSIWKRYEGSFITSATLIVMLWINNNVVLTDIYRIWMFWTENEAVILFLPVWASRKLK